ncbi:MgtC/SapB family protein [Tumebacillus permanentifrigoris]|uniref:Putative Mg2+ transporter-C (MgtC) family protein n=1 Tax=Tumebacillus permanentifrigoris TaxID=378543 RepID=A0A316D4W7_9BACL|nr:MgtC/SapB family protein [Tumebacillus permanentifrigoris]PWK07014.1 putative Mg2+ transporter-C (MgtC) family protein [Tumebacillus permanentifrigoris]
MIEESHWIFLARLVLSVVLGGIMGWERERKNKSAGLKTHILVAVAGCLLMWLSMHGFSEFANDPRVSVDPARLAAQVGGGIGGFLAAGIFLRSDRFAISGYSTAGMLLLALIIGFACGGGQYFVAVVTVMVVVACMVWLDPIQSRLHKQKPKRLTYLSMDRPALLAEIAAILGKHSINITDVCIEEEEGSVQTVMEITSPLTIDWDKVVREIADVESVLSVGLE